MGATTATVNIMAAEKQRLLVIAFLVSVIAAMRRTAFVVLFAPENVAQRTGRAFAAMAAFGDFFGQVGGTMILGAS